MASLRHNRSSARRHMRALGSASDSPWSSIRPRDKVLSSPGQFGWGGMASTTFFCDPVEDLHVIFLTQLVPSSAYPIRQELKALVHQALID